jgi:hypothetical protein
MMTDVYKGLALYTASSIERRRSMEDRQEVTDDAEEEQMDNRQAATDNANTK